MRSDLLALTPESVATLANMGLVKRALREIEGGTGPTLSETNGTVVGVFPDGTEAKLPENVALGDAPCSCGAPTVCRHRVAVALAYGTWIKTQVSDEPLESSVAWDPGTVDDETLLEAVGKRVFERARLDRRQGVVAEVRRSQGRTPPQVRLPTCTIVFLVPNALNYARCDCERKVGCEHVALGVWAFIEANRSFPDRDMATVALHEGGGVDDPLASTRSIAPLILQEGVAHLGTAVVARIQHIATELEPQGYTWVSLLLVDLVEQLQAYRDRSARYSAEKVTHLLVELEARRRAITGKGELPASFVLGQGEARETRLAQLRLISLGTRIVAEGNDRVAETCLADPDTGTLLIHQKRWTFEENPPTSHELGSRLATTGVRLDALATGQVISRNAKRWANREVGFGPAKQTSVTGQNGDWSILPASIRVEDLSTLLRSRADRPPRMLRPRQLSEDLHVFPVAAQGSPAWSPVEQEMVLPIQDPSGTWIPVVATWRAATPKRTLALAKASESPISWVCGRLRVDRQGPRIDPISVMSDRMWVLDLENPVNATFEHLPAESVHGAPWRALGEWLDSAVHDGLLRASDPADLQQQLEQAGWAACVKRVEQLRKFSQQSKEEEGFDSAAKAWLDLGILVSLLSEESE